VAIDRHPGIRDSLGVVEELHARSKSKLDHEIRS
jgi:hypothetical protein